MAQWDDSENYDTPYPPNQQSGGTPSNPNGPGSPVWNRVVELYQNALGRAPENDSVIQQWIQGTGGDIAAIQQGIYATPEAQQYSASRQQPAPPTETGTTTPTPTPTPTPGPAAPTPPTPTPSPPTPLTPTPPPPPPGGPIPNDPAPPPQTSTGPAPVLPTYTPPPAYVPPPAFQYDPFTAPDPNDLLNDPSYQFENREGIQAIGQKNAALGTLNTGGTIKDFIGFGQNLASTRYNDLWNRKAQEYTLNRGNALDAYNTNYGTQYKDPYSINYQSQYVDPFAMNTQTGEATYAAQQHNYDQNLSYAQNAIGLNQNQSQFDASLGQNNSQFNSTMDFQKWLQNYKMSVTDPFDMKYKTLSLL